MDQLDLGLSTGLTRPRFLLARDEYFLQLGQLLTRPYTYNGGVEQQPTRLQSSRGCGTYHFYYASSVQRMSQYNCFKGLVMLGAGYWLEVSTMGRKHDGSVTIQLLDRATHQPCSLEEWRAQAATIPCPEERTIIMTVDSRGGTDHLGPYVDPGSMRSRLHGVSLRFKMEGRSSSGSAKLFQGPEPPVQSSMRSWHVFEME